MRQSPSARSSCPAMRNFGRKPWSVQRSKTAGGDVVVGGVSVILNWIRPLVVWQKWGQLIDDFLRFINGKWCEIQTYMIHISLLSGVKRSPQVKRYFANINNSLNLSDLPLHRLPFPSLGQEDLVTDTLDELPLELPGGVAAASNRRGCLCRMRIFFRNLAAQRKASNMIRHQNILSIDRYLKMVVNMFPVCFPEWVSYPARRPSNASQSLSNQRQWKRA